MWAFRTTPYRSTGDTPYSLIYGRDVTIPLEVGPSTLWTLQRESGNNDQALEEALDFAESRRETPSIYLVNYKSTLIKQRKTQTNPRDFKVGELVLRKTLGITVQSQHGKLWQNWEGPYMVTSSTSTGSYHIQDMNGQPIPNQWNVANLRNYPLNAKGNERALVFAKYVEMNEIVLFQEKIAFKN